MKTLIKDQKDLFAYIDSDFENWNVNEGVTEKALSLNPVKLEKDGTYKEIFKETLPVTQEEVIEWATKNKEEILKTGYYYHFLLRNTDGDKFVAYVFKRDGALDVRVHKFSDDYVWDASVGRVFVFPQHDISTLSPSTLGNSDSLSLESAIELVKSNGYKVIKEF